MESGTRACGVPEEDELGRLGGGTLEEEEGVQVPAQLLPIILAHHSSNP